MIVAVLDWCLGILGKVNSCKIANHMEQTSLRISRGGWFQWAPIVVNGPFYVHNSQPAVKMLAR